MNRIGTTRHGPGHPHEAPLIVIQGCMGSYRDEFFAEIMRRCPKAKFYVGSNHFDATVTLSPAIAKECVRVENLFLLQRRALWQRDVLRPAIGAHCTVVELNPRILSVWVILLGRKAFRRRTIMWGHAWPRKGPESPTMWLRRIMIWFSSGVLLYTPEDQRALAGKTRRATFVAPNAVCSRASTTVAQGTARNVVQIGRLVDGKRPALTLKAWASVCHLLPDSDLIFVGAGPLEQDLRDQAGQLRIEDRVRFAGHISDPEALRKIFGDAFVTVSAGYAGLSITHGFAHGVPALIADDEPHAPEIALANNRNSKLFSAKSPQALARILLEMYTDASLWNSRRAEISECTLENYSAESMADGFLSAVHGG